MAATDPQLGVVDWVPTVVDCEFATSKIFSWSKNVLGLGSGVMCGVVVKSCEKLDEDREGEASVELEVHVLASELVTNSEPNKKVTLMICQTTIMGM